MATGDSDIGSTGLAIPRQSTSSFLRWILSLLFVFALLYGPTLVATGSGALSVVLGMSFLSSFVYGKRFCWSAEFLGISFLLIAGFALVLGICQLVALYGGGDLYFLQLLIATCLVYVPTTYFVARTIGHHANAVGIALRMLAWACFLQSLFIIGDWLVPEVHSVLSSIVIQPESVERSYRVAGLSSSTGDGLSFRQALGAMGAMHLSVVAATRKARVWWITVACVCLLSMVFVGRTGVILFLAFAFFYGLSSRSKSSVAQSFLVILIIYGVIGVLGVILMPSAQREFLYNVVLPHAFELMFSYSAGTGLNVGSLEVITGRMMFLPESLHTMLIGDGYWLNPIGSGNYVPSDIGYVRSIYYVGIIGSLIIYLWYVLFWYVLRRIAADGNTKAFINGLFAALFISHVKFPFLYSGTTVIVCFLLLFVLYIDRQSEIFLTRHIRSLYDMHLRMFSKPVPT